MIIQEVPSLFQTIQVYTSPPYGNGVYMEQICHEYFVKHKNSIITDKIYLPIYWTAYFVGNRYKHESPELYEWLDTLDKNLQYFTIVQTAHGIWITEHLKCLNITVFSAGGGGMSVFSIGNTIRLLELPTGYHRYAFFGEKGDYNLPLQYFPAFPKINVEKNIHCSFVGRLDTHPIRYEMRNILSKNPIFEIHEPLDCDKYIDIMNRSTFTLAPRGFGYTSYRIFEAICAGSIPVYIWKDKCVLPYEDVLNWEQIAIVVHADNMHTIPDLLMKANVHEMQEKLEEVKSMFTFDGMMKYICERIKIPTKHLAYNKMMKTIHEDVLNPGDEGSYVYETKELDAFLAVYDKMICRSSCAAELLALYTSLKNIKPSLVIQSGVCDGASTYIIRMALPDAKIVCLNNSPLPANVWKDNSEKTAYYVGYIDFAEYSVPIEEYAFAVFSDGYNQLFRLLQSYQKKIKHVFFNQNFPENCGSFFTMKHLYGNDARYVDISGIINAAPWLNNTGNYEYMKKNVLGFVDKYCIYPNVYSCKKDGQDIAGTSMFDENRVTEKYKIFFEDRMKYCWPTYMKLNLDKRRISIAITHYNNSAFLEEAIVEVIDDYRVSEIVICDDKSKPDELEKLEALLCKIQCPKIKLYKNEVNLGCYHNKINVISKCTNEWAVLLDSDNILTRNYIDRLYNIYEWSTHTIYHPSWAKTFPVGPSPYLDFRKFEKQYVTPKKFVQYFYDTQFQCMINNCNYFLPVSTFYRCMQKVQHNYDRHNIESLDSAVLFKDWIMHHNRMYILDELHYRHRIHPNSNFILTHRNISNRDEILDNIHKEVRIALPNFEIRVDPAGENETLAHM